MHYFEERYFVEDISLCAADDLLFGHLPGISRKRTQTLGRGDDRCNVRLSRVTTSGKSELQR